MFSFFSFFSVSMFQKRQYFVVHTNLYLLYFFLIIFVFSIFLYVFIFLLLFICVPYFREFPSIQGLTLNWSDFDFFPRLFFKKRLKFNVFFSKTIVEKAKPLGKKSIEFQHFFETIILEENRISLSSRSALESKEFPQKRGKINIHFETK